MYFPPLKCLTEFNEEEFIRNRREEGFEEGAYQKALETARSGIIMGLSTDQITKLTGLSINEINAIQI